MYSHNTNYNPQIIQTSIKKSEFNQGIVMKNDTDISVEDILKLLNPFVDFLNSFLTIPAPILSTKFTLIEKL